MGYILSGDPGSGAATAEMASAEAGQPVEWRDVSLDGDRRRGADSLAVNPTGRVPPLLLPDGTTPTESFAFLLTVADRHPETALLPPPGDAGRARALRRMALLAGGFYPHATRHDDPGRFGADPSRSGRLRRRAQEMGREVPRPIETHAGPAGDPAAPFLLAPRFGLADISLVVLSRWMDGRAWTPANPPETEALTRAVAARPAIAPLWRRHRFTPDRPGACPAAAVFGAAITPGSSRGVPGFGHDRPTTAAWCPRVGGRHRRARHRSGHRHKGPRRRRRPPPWRAGAPGRGPGTGTTR